MKRLHDPRWAKLFGADAPDSTNFPEDSRNRAMAEANVRVREIVTGEFDPDRKRIGGDKNLSKAGRAHKLAELARVTLGRLAKFRDDLEHYHRPAVEALRDKLRARPREGGAGAAVERAELRRLLLEHDETKRVEILTQAVDTGDTMTFDVFDSAPTWVGLVNPGVLDEYRTAWRKARNPELARELAQSEELLGRLENALAMAEAEVEEAGGVKDPVREMADKTGARSMARDVA